MKLTIGMPSYNNLAEVFFTVQSLKLHHDLTDTEIVVVDNFGDDNLQAFCKKAGVVYERYVAIEGVSPAKNKVFEIAKGDYVLCMDSHILLAKCALENLPQTDDFYQGPLLHADNKNYTYTWEPTWRGHMWGIWGKNYHVPPEKPMEIWAMGAGFFYCRRDTWLGFNPKFRGFGGETGYIQEKYRKSGRKVICWPSLVWMHLFGRKVPFKLDDVDRVRNYLLGFTELGIDTAEIKTHFGQELYDKAIKSMEVQKS
jgi:glycosyltransferase involved in cell wall biosynthesis